MTKSEAIKRIEGLISDFVCFENARTFDLSFMFEQGDDENLEFLHALEAADLNEEGYKTEAIRCYVENVGVKGNTREYIVMETQGGAEYAIIVTDEDGNNKVFYTEEEAQKEADECQDGVVIPM